MDIIYQRCCGLDVHKKSITACVITPEGKELKTFGTMTDDLVALVQWIKSKGCTHVAMESTGVYWKPIYNLLEMEEITTLVVNAQHFKAVAGRKTDLKDAEWLADLLRHGLLQGSYIPDRTQRELRELVRYRKSLINERAREVNRLQKVLEGANIKLSSVASDVLGVSGRSMIEAIIHGINDPKFLVGLARGRMKSNKEQLEKALTGLIGPHQRMLLAAILEHIDFLDQQIARLDQEIEERMRPFEEALALLDTIPGVGRRAAEQILAEIGTNMERFPTAAHLACLKRGCVRATMRVPESASRAGRAKGTILYAIPWSKLPGLLPEPKTPTFPFSITGLPPAGAPTGRPLPLATVFW